MKRFRQGQTVYRVYMSLDEDFNSEPRMDVIFLHSQKYPIPPMGQIIDEWNVAHFNRMMGLHGKADILTSRRKAETRFKQLKKQAR